jgi:group II intron reverse transcriptase/maturase
MSPGLVRAAEAAQRNRGRLLSLAHHIDKDALRRAYTRIRGNAAAEVDGVTKQEYGEELEENLQDLLDRLRSKRYRHQPIRRVYIEKEGGKRRPIGVSCVEDKIVQDSLRELLEAICEQDFLPCSFGFRPGRNAHDAMRALDTAARHGGASWVLEADIVSCFDRIDRKKLMELLQRRCADKSLLRLVGKCLHVGILEDGGTVSPETGTTQGSSLSPLLANVYLHHALDLWFEGEVKAKLKGNATFVRFADDFIMAFGRKEDAEQVQRWLVSRLSEYGLELHPDRTRLVDFRRPPPSQRGGKGPSTIDFLGFTVLWTRSRQGNWYLATHTRVSRLRRARKAIHAWCKNHRHLPVKVQHAALVRRIRGHLNYFDVRGNIRRARLVVRVAEWSWHKWLNRRSQRSTMSWKRFKDLLRAYPLPVPTSRAVLWGNAL